MRAVRRFGKAYLLVVAVLLGGFSLMLMLVLLGTAAPAAANTQATISFQAPDGNIPVGTEITVTVHLSDVADMYAMALVVDYPADKLKVVDSDPLKPGIQAIPANCPSPVMPLGLIVDNRADNDAGRLSYGVTQLAPTPPVNGHCDVLQVRFRTVGGPTADLHFTSVRPADRDGNELPVTLVDRQLSLSGLDLYLPLLLRKS